MSRYIYGIEFLRQYDADDAEHQGRDAHALAVLDLAAGLVAALGTITRSHTALWASKGDTGSHRGD